MESIAVSCEALRVSEIIAELELPISKRVELVEAIKDFALRERQEGFNDGINEVRALLEKQVVK